MVGAFRATTARRPAATGAAVSLRSCTTAAVCPDQCRYRGCYSIHCMHRHHCSGVSRTAAGPKCTLSAAPQRNFNVA